VNDDAVIGCEEALRRLAEYLDRELEPSQHEAVERHVKLCRSCFSRADFERLLKERLTDLGREEAPAQLQSRIRKLMGGF
jgi:anti-sigma factor (TIGR02949 family)